MDDGKRNSYGGYCPNFRGSLYYTPSLDETDNPAMLKELKNVNISTMNMAYTKPELKSTVYTRETEPSSTGYSNFRASHAQKYFDMKEAHRDRLATGDGPFSGCVLPPYIGASETKVAFTEEALIKRECMNRSPYLDPPGSRDSGFTHAESPNTLDGRVLDPVWAGAPPDLGRMGHSVYKFDFQPRQLLNGREHHEFASPTCSKITSYNRFHELNPCFAPHGLPSHCDQLETTYIHDYPKKTSHCNTRGKEVVGKGPSVYGGGADLNLFQGNSYWLTESQERFVDPTPEGRASRGHLRGANLLPTSGSGFSNNNRTIPRVFTDPCGPVDYEVGAGDPTHYDPWPRFWMGHKGILDHNYRPHPVTEGTEYQLTKIQPGTSYEDAPALI